MTRENRSVWWLVGAVLFIGVCAALATDDEYAAMKRPFLDAVRRSGW